MYNSVQANVDQFTLVSSILIKQELPSDPTEARALLILKVHLGDWAADKDICFAVVIIDYVELGCTLTY
jgi:hypothetical protein